MPWVESSLHFGLPRGIAARIVVGLLVLLAAASSWVLFSVAWEPADAGDAAQKLRLGAVALVSGLCVVLLLVREKWEPEPGARAHRVSEESQVLPWWADPMGTAAFDGVLTLDDQALIRSVNYGAEELFGYTAEELMGHSLLKIIQADSGFSGAERLADADDQREGINLKVTGQPKDGKTFPLELRLTRFERGSRAMYFGVCRKRQAEELGPAPAWSTQTGWAERFMARIGQDVNRAATAIQGFSEVMRERLPAADSLLSDVAEIEATGQQIAQLSQSLQIVARIPGNGAQTELHPWLKEFARGPAAGRGIELELAASNPVVLARPAFLRVVMAYLLAGMGTREGEAEKIRIGTRDDRPGHRVLVEVTGAEPKMPPDSLPIELARAILGKNGGELEITEAPGGGVLVRLGFLLVSTH